MIRIDCPFCGIRDHNEFIYLEDGSKNKPLFSNTSEKDWYEAIFLRENPKGRHIERWHHIHGCRMILRVIRNTVTHKIEKVEPCNNNYLQVLKRVKVIK